MWIVLLPCCRPVLLSCTAGRVLPRCRSPQSTASVCGGNCPSFLSERIPHPSHAAFSEHKIYRNLEKQTNKKQPFDLHPSFDVPCTLMCNYYTITFYEALLTHYGAKGTYPGSHFTLPEPALLSDFVGASKLLHVLAEITLSTVFSPPARLTFPAHPHWTLYLGEINKRQ